MTGYYNWLGGAKMRDNDMPSERRSCATPGFTDDVCAGDSFTSMEKPFETEATRTRVDREGSPTSTRWDDRYERGHGELMERDCEQARYRAIGQIVAALPAHSSLLDVGCGIGTMADYLPALDYAGMLVRTTCRYRLSFFKPCNQASSCLEHLHEPIVIAVGAIRTFFGMG